MNRLMTTALTIVLALFAEIASGAETDQYFERDKPLPDATAELNRKFNAKLATVVQENRDVRRQEVIVQAVFESLGGYGMTDRFESWALKSPKVVTREVGLDDSIYAGMPVWSIRAVSFSGLGDTIRVNDQLIGTDKLSHFLSQGRKFYRRYLRSESEKEAAERGVLTEKAIFGSGMTGSFSNADLVANYEGYRFYRSLFEDDIVAGKPAILRWTVDGWIVQREFDWADHVNEYWDEALNVNAFDGLLHDRMIARLEDLCPQYWADPALYVIADEPELRQRYAHLGMRDTRDHRLSALCQGDMGSDNRMFAVY